MDIHEIDTPALIVDLGVMEANLHRLQSYCDSHGLRLRPHVKTHKSPAIARMQLDAGAAGIACQKIGEAEVMAEAGIGDILIPFNIVGRLKLARLAALARQAEITVAVDSWEVAGPMAEFLSAEGVRAGVLIELASGLNRCGLAEADEAVRLAQAIAQRRGLVFRGLMVYPSDEKSMPLVERTLRALRAAGLDAPIVSGGGVDWAYRSHEFPALTEIRVGTYVFNDWTVVREGHCAAGDCALTVLVTVVSTPAPGRAIIDGGSKTFSSDGGLPMGRVVEHPEAVVYRLSEEHGFVDVKACPTPPRVGERLRLIPNHACGTVNMHDTLVGIRAGRVEAVWPIAARGKVR